MTTFVFAHGAGGHRDDPGMQRLSEILSRLKIDVVRFNFPYRERGSKRPDAMPVLKSSMREVIERVRDKPLLIGGRSMGGRVATMLAADGFACDGLLLFAYPLHPPGQPEKLRSEHLPRITAPVLCFNGTRDDFCRRDLMEEALNKTKDWTQHWLEGARHSIDARFDVEVGAVIAKWVRSYPF